jgi:uncharacterized delta-60 repeat protein
MNKLFSVRTIILAGSLLLQVNTLCFHARGAAGDVDLSFDPGSGVNGGVSAIAVQPDGKVIIGGDFATVKGLVRHGIARLNADGSGDPSFNPGTAFDASRYVGAVALQSDGKVLIAVVTASYEGYAARLNRDGTLDNSFNPDTDAPVFSVALQPDGKVLIGGGFTTVNGTNRSGIARLNADGSLDTSFDPGTGANGEVRSITSQSDGKVLVGGYFSAVNGTNRNGIARLNADGSLDSSFDPGTGTGTYYVTSVALQPDGKVLIGGDITTVNGTNRNGIARLNTDGSLDSSFNAGTGTDSTVYSITLQANGKILVARWFSDLNGTRGIARLNANGSRDITFTWGAGGYGGFGYAIALQPDGKMLIGGDFFTVNEVQRSSIARLNADGTLDGSFQPGQRMNMIFSTLIALPGGKVLLNGFVHGTNQTGSFRLNANGSLDGTFISANFVPALGPDPTGLGGNAGITVEVGQSNGKVFVAGDYGGVSCDVGEGEPCVSFSSLFLARFNADGSRDTNFARAIGDTIVSPSPGESVRALAVQPDGKVVVGGYFNSIKGTNCHGIARLNANGSLDNSFNAAGVGNYYSVSSVALQSDGKVLIGGNFIAVNGTNRNNIARLNANGSLDSSFNPGTGADGGVSSVALQSDGKVLIGGYFTTINGTNRNHIARLNANGSLDSNFNPGTGADSTVYSIALQSDGKVLIGGDFITVNGVLRSHVARLYADSAPSLNITRSNAFVIVSWPSPSTGFVLQQNTDLKTTNWTTASEIVTDNGMIRFITVSQAPGNRFYRLFKP